MRETCACSPVMTQSVTGIDLKGSIKENECFHLPLQSQGLSGEKYGLWETVPAHNCPIAIN